MYLLPFFFSILNIYVYLMWLKSEYIYILHILLNIMLQALYVVCMFSHVSEKLCRIVVFVLSVIRGCLFFVLVPSLSFNIRNIYWLLSSTVICMVFTSCLYWHWIGRTLCKSRVKLTFLTQPHGWEVFLSVYFYIRHLGFKLLFNILYIYIYKKLPS